MASRVGGVPRREEPPLQVAVAGRVEEDEEGSDQVGPERNWAILEMLDFDCFGSIGGKSG